MSEAPTARLHLMAFLWDELAGSGSAPLFHVEFREELDALRRFQESFPQGDPTPLVRLLEDKIMRGFRLKFSRKEVQRLRARLNWMN